MTADLDAALAAALSAVPPPRPHSDGCRCPSCYEARHAEAERRTWRELDAAQRAAGQLREDPSC